MRKTLTELANDFGTDKGTLVGNKHCYTLIYEKLFQEMQSREVRLLEIGLSIGGPELGFAAERQVLNVPSVEMWLSYFSKGQICSIDFYRKDDFGVLVPVHQRERHGFLKRQRMVRKRRHLGKIANPVKLAVIQKVDHV